MLPYFDAHCDTIAALMKHGGSLGRNGYHVDLERLEAYAPRGQIFALFGDIGAQMRRAAVSSTAGRRRISTAPRARERPRPCSRSKARNCSTP